MLYAPNTAAVVDVYTGQTPDLVHCGALFVSLPAGAQVYDAGVDRALACLQCVSQQRQCSDLLLAVMVAGGDERAVMTALPAQISHKHAMTPFAE